jgi:hypothetical protein
MGTGGDSDAHWLVPKVKPQIPPLRYLGSVEVGSVDEVYAVLFNGEPAEVNVGGGPRRGESGNAPVPRLAGAEGWQI